MGIAARRALLTANVDLGDVVTKAVTYSNSNVLSIPASTSVGDLLLVFQSTYAYTPTTPSGFTNIRSVSANGVFTEGSFAAYKIATAAGSGSIVLDTGGATYTGAALIVITGHKASAPINNSNSNASSGGLNNTAMSTNSVSTTAPVRRYMFWSAMSQTGTMPNFTIATSGAEIQTDVGASTGTYHRVQAWRHATMDGAGTLSAHVMNVDTSSTMIGIVVAVASG